MPLNLMQANAGTRKFNEPMQAPMQLPPGVPQPGPAMGVVGSPAGLASLASGGYRGPNPVTTIGRGGIDFSGFPGAMNGVSPMGLPPQAAMAPGMSGQMIGPPQGLPGMDMRPDLNTLSAGTNPAGPPPLPDLVNGQPPAGAVRGLMGPPTAIGQRYGLPGY